MQSLYLANYDVIKVIVTSRDNLEQSFVTKKFLGTSISILFMHQNCKCQNCSSKSFDLHITIFMLDEKFYDFKTLEQVANKLKPRITQTVNKQN